MKSSYAPLLLVIGSIILTVAGIYYITTFNDLVYKSAQYLAEDYANTHISYYYIFVYQPFVIRYNFLNYVVTNLFSKDEYNLESIYRSDLISGYPKCKKNYIIYLYDYDNGKVTYKPCIPPLPTDNYLSKINGINSLLNKINQELNNMNNLIEEDGIPIKNKGCKYSLGVFECDYEYNFQRDIYFSRYFNLNVEYHLIENILYYNYLLGQIYNNTFALFNLSLLNLSFLLDNYEKYEIMENGNYIKVKLSPKSNSLFLLNIYSKNKIFNDNINIDIILPCSYLETYLGSCNLSLANKDNYVSLSEDIEKCLEGPYGEINQTIKNIFFTEVKEYYLIEKNITLTDYKEDTIKYARLSDGGLPEIELYDYYLLFTLYNCTIGLDSNGNEVVSLEYKDFSLLFENIPLLKIRK